MGKKKRKKKPSKPEPDLHKIIMRIGLYMFLVIAVMGVAFEARARSNAIATRDAWRAARDEKEDANGEFLPAELSSHIKGSPWVSKGEIDAHKGQVTEKYSYVWKGPFMEYDVRVYLGFGVQQKAVAYIDGRGEQAD